MKYLVLIGLGLLVGCSGGDKTEDLPSFCSALLSWGPPEFRMNGSPITVAELAKYTIYVNEEEGQDQSTLVMVIDVENSSMVAWVIESLPLTSHWFYLTVTDTEGRVSPYSNELPKNCS